MDQLCKKEWQELNNVVRQMWKTWQNLLLFDRLNKVVAKVRSVLIEGQAFKRQVCQCFCHGHVDSFRGSSRVEIIVSTVTIRVHISTMVI